ncbi:MAG TPA: hypothetical protein DF480_06065 [Clostridiales bacterium]|nr:hypothetical protein [Clostridiales bacterium]
MKKTIALLMVALMAIALLAGCGGTEPTAEPVKTGFAVLNSIVKSKDATAEADGLAQADSLIVALTVDASGIITDCVIDQAQSKVNFNTAGELVTPLDATFKTKNELGTEYGMNEASTIGKEWNEQAEAFAQYVIGKTAAEVAGIAISDGYAADADLLASVTVHITDFMAGVEKAVANATDLGAAKGDTLSIATTTNIAKSKNVNETELGLAQVYSTYVAMTQNAEGMITSCIFDGSQSNVNFDAAGMITTDLSVAPRTKNELKEEYGMLKASTIGKEWYEQAAGFAAYVTGKTVEEVQGIAISEGYAADADLLASVTVHITDFIGLVEKAAQ